MDWSTVKQGRFASGDCSKQVYLWEPTEDGLWSICETPFVGHESSVEDLQWSPSEPNALASCSSDKTIKIWDARQKSRCAISVRAHQCDVNVISWNKLVSYLLVSGGDDGEFKVWDLRTFGAKALPIATFKWHTDAITSVEWHPCDESVLAVSGADDQISLWDLSLEEDYEVSSPEEQSKIPAQLLFVHQGQNHIKEAHWHPQVPGLLASTAASGINVFKTINI
ncbi:glutamate-rich WD repeat-containing protein 1-like [Zophobas morio]